MHTWLLKIREKVQKRNAHWIESREENIRIKFKMGILKELISWLPIFLHELVSPPGTIHKHRLKPWNDQKVFCIWV